MPRLNLACLREIAALAAPGRATWIAGEVERGGIEPAARASRLGIAPVQ